MNKAIKNCIYYSYKHLIILIITLTVSYVHATTNPPINNKAEAATNKEYKDNTDSKKLPILIPKILIWGDSLSAAYGIPVENGWASLLQKKFIPDDNNDDKLPNIQVYNGSISGETTQGGLTRLPAALEHFQPHVLILELGANDGLRGINPKVTRKNLDSMIQLAQEKSIHVVLLGIKLPPNFGPVFNQQFDANFSELAKQYRLAFHPFFLEKVALDYDLMQSDGLHPNSKAQPLILETIWPVLEPVIKAVTTTVDDNDNK